MTGQEIKRPTRM